MVGSCFAAVGVILHRSLKYILFFFNIHGLTLYTLFFTLWYTSTRVVWKKLREHFGLVVECKVL